MAAWSGSSSGSRCATKSGPAPTYGSPGKPGTACGVRSPGETTLLIDARGFAPEGENCDAALAIKAYRLGWRRLVHYNTRGTRFHGAGLGPGTAGLRIDCYDNPGDYLGSGMDGLEIHVHGNAQDQLCQISKRGKLVVYGDVGQTFLYGAKGGEVYVLGNAAGRPMINAVGSPRVVINGTALDFLAESFMAGDPHNGGGFAIVNGLRYDQHGRLHPLDLPVPGRQPALAGLRRRDLHPRSPPHAGRRAAQRRGVPARCPPPTGGSSCRTWKRTSGCSASASTAIC